MSDEYHMEKSVNYLVVKPVPKDNLKTFKRLHIPPKTKAKKNPQKTPNKPKTKIKQNNSKQSMKHTEEKGKLIQGKLR